MHYGIKMLSSEIVLYAIISSKKAVYNEPIYPQLLKLIFSQGLLIVFVVSKTGS